MNVADRTTLSAGIQRAGGVVMSDQESEDWRWRQWKAKGRADDLRFRRRLRTIVDDGAAVVAIGGAFWFAFQF